MQTLSYGYKKPQDGDNSSVWFDALEDDITQLNSHDHDGTDSAFIPASSLTSYTSSIVAANWSSDGGGNYSYLVTVPAGISGAATRNDVQDYSLTCTINTAGATFGDILALQIERESSTTFTVRTNDNTLDVLILYI